MRAFGALALLAALHGRPLAAQDVRLAGRLDKATPEKGYNGPALVCAAKLTPISGHRASSPLVKFILDGRDIEIWFVPIAGTQLLAPIRLSVASAVGTLLLRADQFETQPALASGKL